ncbi:MAG: LppX_LprAFG lipoprotein [Chloroflexia bacterium]|nr:LppX_LprAFG lipoprotein [Chloroflexia bacterium]
MANRPDADDRWVHPLITIRNPQWSRRRLFIVGSGGLAVAAGAGPGSLSAIAGQATPPATPLATPSASPEASPVADELTGDPEATALLRDAAAAMADLDTFQFEIATTRGQSTILQGLEVESIAGAVRRPIDFTATVAVGLPFGSIDLTAVGVDGRAYIQDPLSNGEWIELQGGEDAVALINPDTLILSSIRVVKDAGIDGTEDIDGAETTRVTGMIDFAASAEQLSGGSVELPAEISSEPVELLIWIDEQRRIVEIEIAGPLLATESDDVVRTISFFGFDEPVEIEVPVL